MLIYGFRCCLNRTKGVQVTRRLQLIFGFRR